MKKRVIKNWDVLKPSVLQDFSNVKSVTEQRCALNNPQEMWEQFTISEEIHDELEKEQIEDFDDDIYDYDERAEYGVDVALAASLEQPAKNKIQKRFKRSGAETIRDP